MTETLASEKKQKPARSRFYRKRARLFNMINKIKLWPSRSGMLHGIKVMEVQGNTARIVTHCNKEFYINNSLNSRAGRILRNKQHSRACPKCRVPDWKLDKFTATQFKRHQGSLLLDATPHQHAKSPGKNNT